MLDPPYSITRDVFNQPIKFICEAHFGVNTSSLDLFHPSTGETVKNTTDIAVSEDVCV